jgi:hypothetical protein
VRRLYRGRVVACNDVTGRMYGIRPPYRCRLEQRALACLGRDRDARPSGRGHGRHLRPSATVFGNALEGMTVTQLAGTTRDLQAAARAAVRAGDH